MTKVSEGEKWLKFEPSADASTLWSVPITGIRFEYRKGGLGLESVSAETDSVHHAELVTMLRSKLGPPNSEVDTVGYIWFQRAQCVAATTAQSTTGLRGVTFSSPDSGLVSALRQEVSRWETHRQGSNSTRHSAKEATPPQAGPLDPYGIAAALEADIRRFAAGGRVDVELGAILGPHLGVLKIASRDRTALDEITQIKLLSVENGLTLFKGRTLPAGIAKVDVKTVDRVAGEYSSFCILHAIVVDKEFDVRRAPLYELCDAESSDLATWKRQTSFSGVGAATKATAVATSTPQSLAKDEVSARGEEATAPRIEPYSEDDLRALSQSGQLTEPKEVSRVHAKYPEAARKQRMRGTVLVEAIIDTNGDVGRVTVLRGIPGTRVLDNAAVRCVQQWKYRPATCRGNPVPFRLSVTVTFSLVDDGKK